MTDTGPPEPPDGTAPLVIDIRRHCRYTAICVGLAVLLLLGSRFEIDTQVPAMTTGLATLRLFFVQVLVPSFGFGFAAWSACMTLWLIHATGQSRVAVMLQPVISEEPPPPPHKTH